MATDTQMLAAVQNAVQAINNVTQTLQKVLPVVQSVSSTATGGAATLPANPVGFLVVTNPVTGLPVKVPFYNL